MTGKCKVSVALSVKYALSLGVIFAVWCVAGVLNISSLQIKAACCSEIFVSCQTAQHRNITCVKTVQADYIYGFPAIIWYGIFFFFFLICYQRVWRLECE
jgi:hypothetical protein